MGTTTSINT